MNKKIIESYYYIIKVVCDNGRRTYYKIGETNTKNRPIKLVEKYTALRKNEAEILAFETLPHNDVKRLNDKTIHSNIDSSILESVDPMIIKGCLDEVDGITEFFNLKDSSVDIVEYIKNLVASIKKSQYTANVYYDTELEYSKDQYHLVDSDIVAKIIDTYPNVTDKLYGPDKLNILLIGQFEPEFIMTFVMRHNVTLWHDSVDNKYNNYSNYMNRNISYINTLGELLMSDKDFDIIISNPPYGKIGAEITYNIINNINYKEFINLMPIKDYDINIGNHVEFDKIVCLAPHSFGDADILTHINIINKNDINNFKSNKELCAASFNIDKPFIKFMKANELRNHYAIDNIHSWKPENEVNTTFVFHGLATNSQHTCGLAKVDSKTFTNPYNLNNIIIDKVTDGYAGHLTSNACRSICFNTIVEKQNFVNFFKQNRNFINRMIANQFIGLRDHAACFPKVDWVKEWTIEEILKDVANYTDEEIQLVLDTMDKDYSIGKDSDIERLFGAYL